MHFFVCVFRVHRGEFFCVCLCANIHPCIHAYIHTQADDDEDDDDEDQEEEDDGSEAEEDQAPASIKQNSKKSPVSIVGKGEKKPAEAVQDKKKPQKQDKKDGAKQTKAEEGVHAKSESPAAGKRKAPEGDENALNGSEQKSRNVKAKADTPASKSPKKDADSASIATKVCVPVAKPQTNKLGGGFSLTDIALGTGKYAKSGVCMYVFVNMYVNNTMNSCI
jgi:hypothetical protein